MRRKLEPRTIDIADEVHFGPGKSGCGIVSHAGLCVD